MPDTIENFSSRPSEREDTRWRVISLCLVAAFLCSLPFVEMFPDQWDAALTVVGLSFLLVVLVYALYVVVVARIDARQALVLSAMIEADDDVCLITNSHGDIRVANAQARDRFRICKGQTLDACLHSLLANPGVILLRLLARTRDHSHASENIVTQGQATRISVTRIENGLYFWRITLDAEKHWNDIPIPILTLGH